MKRLLLQTILLTMTILGCHAETDDWQPTPEWPFIYAEFKSAIITTTQNKVIKAQANVHIGRHFLWYKSASNQNLEAKHGTFKEIKFSDGSRFIEVEGKACRIVSEDTVSGKIRRLLVSTEIDMEQYNETLRNRKRAESSSGIDIIGLNDLNIDMSVRATAGNADSEPLPLREVYYIQVDNDTFEATESKILKHLANKEERTAYRVYTRKAEIITGSLKSMYDLYTTFFLK